MKKYILIIIATLFSLAGFSQYNWIEGDSLMISGGGVFGNILTMDTNQIKQVDTATDQYDAMPLFQVMDSINAGLGSATLLGLTDMPSSYSGTGGYIMRVASGETSGEFSAPATTIVNGGDSIVLQDVAYDAIHWTKEK